MQGLINLQILYLILKESYEICYIHRTDNLLYGYINVLRTSYLLNMHIDDDSYF